MDKITFNPENHVYHNETKGFDYKWTGSRVASAMSGHDLSKVNPVFLEESANYGTEMHKTVEVAFVTDSAIVESDTAQWCIENFYSKYAQWNMEEIIYTEGLVLDYAGKADAIGFADGKYKIFDLKTGKKDLKYWTAQLSCYRYAFCQMNNLKTEDVELGVWHCPKSGVFEYFEIKGYSDEEFLKRLEAVANEGKEIQVADDNTTALMNSIEKALEEQLMIQKQIDEYTEHIEQWKAELLKAMNEQGILSLKTEHFSFTPIAPSSSVSLDTAEIKKNKELWDSLPKKTTEKKGYLRITAK